MGCNGQWWVSLGEFDETLKRELQAEQSVNMSRNQEKRRGDSFEYNAGIDHIGNDHCVCQLFVMELSWWEVTSPSWEKDGERRKQHRSSASSVLTTLDGGVARGYVGIPQVERAVAVHLCPRNAATWRNRLTAALAAKAYSAAGQAASALHAMAILQVHQAKAFKQVHEGSTDPGLMQELRTAALRAMKVTSPSLGKAMSTMVVQEHHLWLNLAEMNDVDKARFLDASISQGGLFGDTVEGFAQQFSAVQEQTEAIQHILPRRDAPSTAAPGARPQSARCRGRPPASSRAAPPQAESTHRPVRRASRRRAAPPASQPGPKSSRKSTKRPWRGQPGYVGVCSFSGDGENSAAPSPGGGPGGESSVSFCFCSQRYPPSQRKSNFLFLRVLRSMGWQCSTPCILTIVHDPFCQ